jgi:hypothetical protein
MKFDSPADSLDKINRNTKAFDLAVKSGDKKTARVLADENIALYNRLARVVPLRHQFYRTQVKEWEARAAEIAGMPEPGAAGTPAPAPPKRVHQVFISYSSPDRELANELCTHLEAQGIPCWIAPRDVVPGSNFPGSIVDAIDASKVMVFIFSKSSNSSSHVIRELMRAVTSNILIIPFRIEDILPTKDMDYLINIAQWFNAMPPPAQQHFSKLTETLKAHLSGQQTGTPGTEPRGG